MNGLPPLPVSGSRECGAALVVVLTVLVLGTLGVFLAFSSPLTSTHTEQITRDALSLAREALIGRAAADENQPGSFPCPAADNEGIAALHVGIDCPSYVGRLPWRTLGLPDLRDSSGEILWYALSPRFRYTTLPLNSVETPAEIVITGSDPATNVVAVIIAPERPLPGQTREGTGLTNVSNYLEGENASAGDNRYVTGPESATFNDRLTVITREQLFDVVEWRVASEIRTALRRYYAAFNFFPYASVYSDSTYACANGVTRGRLPSSMSATCTGHTDWPAGTPRTAPPAWFAANDWNALTYYSVAPACTRPTLGCSGSGFINVNGKSNVQAVVIVGGRALGTQIRPCAVASDCIEQPDAGKDVYKAGPRSTSFNDRVLLLTP